MNNQLIKVTQAQKLLGVSKKKIASLIVEGVLPFEADVLDKRVKLLRLADVERLLNMQLRKAA
jgi:hypothetical protein